MDLCLVFQPIIRVNLAQFGDNLSVFVDLGSGNNALFFFLFSLLCFWTRTWHGNQTVHKRLIPGYYLTRYSVYASKNLVR